MASKEPRVDELGVLSVGLWYLGCGRNLQCRAS